LHIPAGATGFKPAEWISPLNLLPCTVRQLSRRYHDYLSLRSFFDEKIIPDAEEKSSSQVAETRRPVFLRMFFSHHRHSGAFSGVE